MLKNFILGSLICCMFMSCCPAGCCLVWAQDGSGGDASTLVPPVGVKITAIDGKPVKSEECQVCSEDGTSAWLPREVAEKLLETLKTANQQKPEGYFSMTCRYE